MWGYDRWYAALCHPVPQQLSRITTLQSCLTSLHTWFCENGMALNPTKSDAILFGTPQRLKSVSDLTSVDVAGTQIKLSGSVKMLGATLHSNLTMGSHIKALSKSCFYHIRSFKQIRSSMDQSTALALVSSRLDYVNSILSSSPLKHITRLQRAQHALARSYCNSDLAPHHLHFLNSFIGFLLSGESGLKSPHLGLQSFTYRQAMHHTSPISYSIIHP